MNKDSIYFEITKKQQEQVRRWIKKIKKKHATIFADKEPSIYYIITPTGIGDGVDVCEVHSQEKLDITDYASW